MANPEARRARGLGVWLVVGSAWASACQGESGDEPPRSPPVAGAAGSTPGPAVPAALAPAAPAGAAPAASDPSPASPSAVSMATAPVGVDEFSPSPRPPVSDLPFPRAEDGTYVVAKSGEVELRYNPTPTPSPMTALLRCLDWLMQCYEKTGQNMDTCVAAVPRCSSERPWQEAAACCPGACSEEYLTLRSSGAAELAAFERVFGESMSCVPAYDRWLAGVAP